MSNVDAPHGFAHVSNDGPYPPRIRTFQKLVGVATAIFQHDVVHAVGGKNIEPFSTGTPGTTVPLGIALTRGAASTASRHSVLIARPDVEFEAQDDNDTDGIIEANLNKNANINTGAGSAITGFSGHEIDEASIAATATLDLKLIKLFAYPNNEFGPHARIVVTFNKCRENPGTAGV